MDTVDKIIREHHNTDLDEVTDIEIVQIRIEKYQESSEEESAQDMPLMDSRMGRAS